MLNSSTSSSPVTLQTTAAASVSTKSSTALVLLRASAAPITPVKRRLYQCSSPPVNGSMLSKPSQVQLHLLARCRDMKCVHHPTRAMRYRQSRISNATREAWFAQMNQRSRVVFHAHVTLPSPTISAAAAADAAVVAASRTLYACDRLGEQLLQLLEGHSH